MIFSSRKLSALVGVPVTLANRYGLPAEERFRGDVYPDFSEDELSAREDSLREVLMPVGKIPERCDWLSIYANLGTIWHVSKNKSGGWTDEALRIGQELFGAAINDIKGSVHSIGAVIVPSSPRLGSTEFWKAFTAGVPVSADREKNLEGILQLHETGHVLFPFTLEEREDLGVAYRYEAYADCFAVAKYRELGGPWTDIHDFIAGRRLAAFLDFSTPSYCTAAACEAALEGKPFPRLPEVLDPLRELQIRVIDNLRGVDRHGWDSATYRKKCKTIRFGGVEIADVWNLQHDSFYDILARFPAEELIKSVSRVLKWTISEQVRIEGEKTLQAFTLLCSPNSDDARPKAELLFGAARLDENSSAGLLN